MKLLAVVLLLLPLSGCLAEVVNDFTVSCPQFFATPNGILLPPTRFPGAQYKQICQTLYGNIEFATFYNTMDKMPVYSAYRFYGHAQCGRKKWFIEPQLDDPVQGGNNMTAEGHLQNPGTNQALNADYSVTVPTPDKGHLVPVYHANTQSCADATFTLTNAAPQNPSFNRGRWRVTEKTVADFLTATCLKAGLRAYVVTGVVPGNNVINNRVRVPSHYWSAYCCLDNNNRSLQSGGYIGDNIPNGPVLQLMTRQNLETILNNHYGTAFSLFGGRC